MKDKHFFLILLQVRLPRGVPIYECNKRCGCGPECPNRVVQHGRRHKVAIFKTRKAGWGVKALQKIKKGSFVMEYVGEVSWEYNQQLHGSSWTIDWLKANCSLIEFHYLNVVSPCDIFIDDCLSSFIMTRYKKYILSPILFNIYCGLLCHLAPVFQVMACCLFSAKPLPAPMLTCQFVIERWDQNQRISNQSTNIFIWIQQK